MLWHQQEYFLVYVAQNLNTLSRKKVCDSDFVILIKRFLFFVSQKKSPYAMWNFFLNTWYSNHKKIFHYITWFNHKKNDLSINGKRGYHLYNGYMDEKPWWSSKWRYLLDMYKCVVCVCGKFENFNKIIFYLYNQIEWQDEK